MENHIQLHIITTRFVNYNNVASIKKMNIIILFCHVQRFARF